MSNARIREVARIALDRISSMRFSKGNAPENRQIPDRFAKGKHGTPDFNPTPHLAAGDPAEVIAKRENDPLWQYHRGQIGYAASGPITIGERPESARQRTWVGDRPSGYLPIHPAQHHRSYDNATALPPEGMAELPPELIKTNDRPGEWRMRIPSLGEGDRGAAEELSANPSIAGPNQHAMSHGDIEFIRQQRENGVDEDEIDRQLNERQHSRNYAEHTIGWPRSSVFNFHGNGHGRPVHSAIFPLQDLLYYAAKGDPYRIYAASILGGNRHAIPLLVDLLKRRDNPAGWWDGWTSLHRRMEREHGDLTPQQVSARLKKIADATESESAKPMEHRQIADNADKSANKMPKVNEPMHAVPVSDFTPYLVLADHMEENGLEHYAAMLRSELHNVLPDWRPKPKGRRRFSNSESVDRFNKVREVARQALTRLGVKRFAKADGSPELVAKPDKAPVFYSHAERVIHEKVPNSAHPDQARKTLLNNGVKPEEMKWSGLEDHLATATGPVKKSDLLERARDGNVKVGEVLKKSEPQDMSGPVPGWGSVGGGNTKYDEYQLPGGSNYHEMLLTLPQQYNDFHIVPPNRLGDTTWTIREEDGGKIISSHNSREEAKKEFDRRYERLPKQFNSSHWSEPNVLAHIRFNDREGPNGEKLLHLEEIQSDWGQGVREHGTIEDIRNQHGVEPNGGTYGGYRVFDKRAAAAGRLSTEAWAETEEEAKEKMEKIVSAKAKEQGSLPSMPFSKTWHELALRRMIRHAAENGYDGISWTPGEQQGKRYSLRNKVDSVHYSPEEKRLWAVSDGKNVIDKTNISEDELHKYVGKDVAGKLLSAEADDDTHDRRTVSGDGLEVGGEGMKGFYDKIIPEYLAKYGKKHGAQVGETSIKLAPDEAKDEKSLEHILRVFGRNSDQYQRALAGSIKDKAKTLQVPFFPITPSMRESVVREGQALFAKRSEKDRFSLSSQPQSFASSLRRLGTKQQTKLREIAAKILHQSGLTPHKLSDALHDTPTDSRPGVAQAIFRPVSREHTRRAAAQYGLVAGQNSLLVFHGHPDGPDSLYAVDLPGGDESRAMLDKAGFDKRMLIPTKTGFRAIIHDPGRASRKKMEDFATGAGLSVIESTGFGEMVGDKKPEISNAKVG